MEPNLLDSESQENNFPWVMYTMRALILIFVAGVIILLGGYLLMTSEVSSSIDTIVEIPTGTSVSGSLDILQNEKVITHKMFMQIAFRLSGDSIAAGSYRFSSPYTHFDVMRRISAGDYGDVYTRLVIPEGSTNEQIQERVMETFPDIHEQELGSLLQNNEGLLFPDTYLFLPDATAIEIVTTMEKQFLVTIEELDPLFKKSNRSREDIFIMASIIEKESYDDMKERRMISGILWKRIDEGMLLQVDATFLYFMGKGSAELTRADLRNESLFNTYVHTGLPPAPIGNSGREAMEAALTPIDSPYYFYLHDKDGRIHYAQTHDGHVANKNNYLR